MDLSAEDSGDGPAVFVIFAIGPVVTGLALWTEVHYAPPLWLHIVIWFPLAIGGCAWLLRPFKAILLALQYKNKAGDAGAGTFD